MALARFTALRPCFTTGLPLSCAIVTLRKIVRLNFALSLREREQQAIWIKQYLAEFVNNFSPGLKSYSDGRDRFALSPVRTNNKLDSVNL